MKYSPLTITKPTKYSVNTAAAPAATQGPTHTRRASLYRQVPHSAASAQHVVVSFAFFSLLELAIERGVQHERSPGRQLRAAVNPVRLRQTDGRRPGGTPLPLSASRNSTRS